MDDYLKPAPLNIGSDFYATFGRVVVTVETKREDNAFVSYWFASVLNRDGQMSVFFELRLPLMGGDTTKPRDSEQALFDECADIFIRFVRPLLAEYQDSEIGIFAGEGLSHPARTVQAMAHLKLHSDLQTLGDDSQNLNVRTAREYQLVKSFGIGTVIETISSFEGVAKTAMTRRVTRARDAGLLEKNMKTTVARNRLAHERRHVDRLDNQN